MEWQSQVEPEALVAVIHTGNLKTRRYHVLRSAYEAGAPYLNTYTRTGRLKMQRRATVPISRAFIVALA